MIMENVKIKHNVLTKEQCVQIISNANNFEYDILKKDIAEQDVNFTKEQLDANTIERSFDQSSDMRKVSQSPMEPVFSEWDGNPVYRCKVMKYEKGEYVREHRDAEWMCMSNYWAPNTNKSSDSVMIIPLNDDYDGGEFTVDGQVIPQEVGSVIQVPCDALDRENNPKHGVRKVRSGTRYSLVFWNFK
jgi:predicted 2-oxoglutarate/Fe(II)-dependent dioxygenase YbiX